MKYTTPLKQSEECDALLSFVDLMRDEFRRIKGLCYGIEDRSEIAGLCDRAVEKMDRTVPVAKENADLRIECDALRDDVEVGLQISGSFFEALKALNLQAINVQNPGQHVTDLIRERDALRAKLAGLDERC